MIMQIYRKLPSEMSSAKRLLFAIVLLLPVALASCGRNRWYESSRASAGLAPAPSEFKDAVVVAYRAKVWGWRGWVADHTWIATKGKDEPSYTVYEVIGWRQRSHGSVLRIEEDLPDRKWFGSVPVPMAEFRGPEAEQLVARVREAATSYPYPDWYRMYPGPNSNTFTAWIAKEVPELELELPHRAIGKNFPFDREPQAK